MIIDLVIINEERAQSQSVLLNIPCDCVLSKAPSCSLPSYAAAATNDDAAGRSELDLPSTSPILNS